MKITLASLFLALTFSTFAQLGTQKTAYSHADTLRGSITPERAWWDLRHYDLHVKFNDADSSVSGFNSIRYSVQKASRRMQIDLMEPLVIDSVFQQHIKQNFTRDGNAFFVTLSAPQSDNSINTLDVYFHGKPRIAVRPPWDGGLVWTHDAKGRTWITIACQGLGASVWFPCKDHQADEPDSTSFHITATDSTGSRALQHPVVCVAGGQLRESAMHMPVKGPAQVTYDWVVRNPINNYNIIPYIGHYYNYEETYQGEKGPLETSYWTLDYNFTKAQTHLRDNVKRTLKNLEYWFGPYPFYEDGYKIVDAPHLGMEHQSAIAYGNGYQNGYLGHDLSGSGWGMKWDFIVVHESAHEWFGNNITTKDLADMWVHESFANYSETLFTTSEFGVEAGNDYVIGTRRNIQNDVPIIGNYDVNEEGSGDMYYKGGNMIHMIRQVIDNDDKFRRVLRGMNSYFYHKTVTSADVEEYIMKTSGVNFSKLFDQYLRTTQIPEFTYSVHQVKGTASISYRWTNCIKGFDLPVKISLGAGNSVWLKPKTTAQTLNVKVASVPVKIVDRNFYVTEKRE